MTKIRREGAFLLVGLGSKTKSQLSSFITQLLTYKTTCIMLTFTEGLRGHHRLFYHMHPRPARNVTADITNMLSLLLVLCR